MYYAIIENEVKHTILAPISGKVACQMNEVKMSKVKDINPLSNQDVNVTPIERQTYTVEEAAKMLGICRALAYRKGVLPTVRISGRLVIPKVALHRMLAGDR